MTHHTYIFGIGNGLHRTGSNLHNIGFEIDENHAIPDKLILIPDKLSCLYKWSNYKFSKFLCNCVSWPNVVSKACEIFSDKLNISYTWMLFKNHYLFCWCTSNFRRKWLWLLFSHRHRLHNAESSNKVNASKVEVYKSFLPKFCILNLKSLLNLGKFIYANVSIINTLSGSLIKLLQIAFLEQAPSYTVYMHYRY